MVTPKCELRSESCLSSVRTKEQRSCISFRFRQVCSSGRIPFVSLAVYSLTSPIYRTSDPVSDTPKSQTSPTQTLRPIPVRSAMSSVHSKRLPVRFLDTKGSHTEAAACLRNISTRCRAFPSGIDLNASISHRPALPSHSAAYVAPELPRGRRSDEHEATIPPLLLAVRRAPCATRCPQMTFGRSSRGRVSPSLARRLNMRCHSGA